MEVLSKHRGGLNAIARALLDNEIIDGREVNRLVDEAYGEPVHTEGAKAVPQFVNGSLSNGDGNGNGTATRRPGHQRAGRPVTPGSRPEPCVGALAPPAVAAPENPPATTPPEDPAEPHALEGDSAANRIAPGCVIEGDGGTTARRLARGGVRRLLPHRLPDSGQPGRRRGGGPGRLPARLALP
jgi:hypothetical protein